MKKYLYVDDIRTPHTDKPWVVVRSFNEAVKYFTDNGCPDYISFDHDIDSYDVNGNEKTGKDVASWIIDKDLDNDGQFIPKDFEFNVHSANSVGRDNINGLLINYLRFRKL